MCQPTIDFLAYHLKPLQSKGLCISLGIPRAPCVTYRAWSHLPTSNGAGLVDLGGFFSPQPARKSPLKPISLNNALRNGGLGFSSRFCRWGIVDLVWQVFLCCCGLFLKTLQWVRQPLNRSSITAKAYSAPRASSRPASPSGGLLVLVLVLVLRGGRSPGRRLSSAKCRDWTGVAAPASQRWSAVVVSTGYG